MARRIFCILLMQSFVCKFLYAQPPKQQYFHLTGTPQSTHTMTIPASKQTAPSGAMLGSPNIAPTNQPRPATGLPSFSGLALPELISKLQELLAIQQTMSPSNHVANQPRPPTGIPSFSAVGLPNQVFSLQQLPTPRPAEVKQEAPSSVDSKLLNNLAIAVQLLIVSNILNAPPPAESRIAKSKEIPPCSEPISSTYYSQAPVAMPNSNFIGSSSFSEPIIAQTYKPTRNSMSLMSPYEAFGTNSPYSDPIFTQYGSVDPRQDFQSPYSMMADNDLFSMNDLF